MATAIVALIFALTAYAAGHYLAAAVLLLSRDRQPPSRCKSDSVTVLIAARNEGAVALHAIRSVLEQNHRGTVAAWLLVRDEEDTAIPFVQDAFDTKPSAETLLTATLGPTRTLAVFGCGVDPKSAKIRLAMERVSTRYVAILDADHIAQPGWIESALCHLQAKENDRKVRVVQGRRYPSSAQGLYRLWDSLHQHVGCEVFNLVFTRLGLGVFFTGTTAVFEASLLRAYPLRDVLTEDADLGYRLFFDDESIIADPQAGSREQVSPDLYSFLARRRRWASGHTEAFLRYLPKLPKARLPILAKLQFLFHGTHYLWAIPVFVLNGLVALWIAPRLETWAYTGALLCGGTLAWALTRTQRTLGVHRLFEWVVLALWWGPAAILVMNACSALLTHDRLRASLRLGPNDPMGLWALVGIGAPLVLLLVGLFRFRRLTLGTFLHVVFTYPLAFLLDISGVLLGLLDLALRRRRWRVVARDSATTAELPEPAIGLKASCSVGGPVRLSQRSTKRSYGGLWSSIALLMFGVGLLGRPQRVVRGSEVHCHAEPADDYPWIEDEAEFCDEEETPMGLRSGEFSPVHDDDFSRIDPSFWTRGNATFPCNESFFVPDNVRQTAGGIRFDIQHTSHADRAFTAGTLHTLDTARHLYGRFEVEMKPSDVSGVVSAFFLYRFDPWQEIDFEFVGNDTRRALLNVYYNPGDDGDLYNYGHSGTPVRVDLGFDASAGFHRYAIEWDRAEIRWFADGRLIHVRREGQPTPIPSLPMVFHMNAWVSCSEALAGPIDVHAMPTGAEFRHLSIEEFIPSPRTGFDALFGLHDQTPSDWLSPHP